MMDFLRHQVMHMYINIDPLDDFLEHYTHAPCVRVSRHDNAKTTPYVGTSPPLTYMTGQSNLLSPCPWTQKSCPWNHVSLLLLSTTVFYSFIEPRVRQYVVEMVHLIWESTTLFVLKRSIVCDQFVSVGAPCAMWAAGCTCRMPHVN
jgi:hypothetical protein